MLVLRRIHVTLELRAAPEHRVTAERVHGVYADSCTPYRSLKAALEITTDVVLVEEAL